MFEQVSFKTILDSIDESVVLLDADLKVWYYNTCAGRLTNVDRTNAIGKELSDVIPLQDMLKEIPAQWDVQSKKTVTDVAIVLPSQEPLPITYSTSPVRADDSTVVGVMVVIHDISREKELIRLRSEFVSIASHQLRTPASAVKWNLEALIDNRRGNELNDWQHDKMQQAYQSNERMIHLINDLLNVSRLDSGRFTLQATGVNVRDLVNDIIAELVHFTDAHNISIHNTLGTEIPLVQSDSDKLREVILNLLTNAIKYSKPGHHVVTVAAELHGKLVHFSVQDQGIGIPAKDAVHIFEKFYRANNAVESQTEGSGLGLYIAREIVRLHGGDVWLHSKEGEGTTVWFSLPIVKV